MIMRSPFKSKKARREYEERHIRNKLRKHGLAARKKNIKLKSMKLPAALKKHVEKSVGTKLDDDFVHIYTYRPKKSFFFRLLHGKNKQWDGVNSCMISAVNNKDGARKEGPAGGYVFIPQSALRDTETRDAALIAEAAALAAAKKLYETGGDPFSSKVPALAHKAEASYLKKKYKSTPKKAEQKAIDAFHNLDNWAIKKKKGKKSSIQLLPPQKKE